MPDEYPLSAQGPDAESGGARTLQSCASVAEARRLSERRRHLVYRTQHAWAGRVQRARDIHAGTTLPGRAALRRVGGGLRLEPARASTGSAVAVRVR